MPISGPAPISPSGQHGQREPLLAPKLRLPRLHSSLVARERLLTQLDAGLERKLTLLSAPAGFGKTTLVSQWVADSRNDQQSGVAWVSLDVGDNDPFRFWHYVITACRVLQEDMGQSALALLHAVPQSPFEPPVLDEVLRMFLNELTALSQRGMLVLEDYQSITSPQIHETVTFLLDHLPPTLHLVVITRVDPPLPLARLRVHDNLNELRAADLRFSQKEAEVFLQQAIPFPLSSEVTMRLEAHMEGWVTGLRLVALALRGKMTGQEVEHVLTTFDGNHRHIVEFFVTEVLNTQPEHLQVFLLQTSVLGRLTGSLCDVVSGRNDSEQMLEAAECANLFLQPLDGSGNWYRYHPLFSEAMQREARRRLGEDALRSCFDRASVWYEQHGMLTEAVEAALDAQTFAHATTLVERLVGTRHLHETHEHHTLRRWLNSLPEEILAQHPRLCLCFAMLLLFSADCQLTNDLTQVERLLSMAEAFWQTGDNRTALGEVLAFRALMNREQGNLSLAVHLARQALASLPESEKQWRGTCLSFIGEEELLAGKLHVARQTFLEAQSLFEAIGNSFATRAMLIVLGDMCSLHGELHQAAELYRTVLATAGEDISDKGKVLSGLARLSYEWNNLDNAEQEAQEALDIGKLLADETLEVHASFVLARIQHVRGRTVDALHILHALLAQILTSSSLTSSLLYREILTEQARLQIATLDLPSVQRWFTASVMHREHVPLLQQEQEDFVAVRLLIAQGRASLLRSTESEDSHESDIVDWNSKIDEALRLLESRKADAHEHGRVRSELEILILMALAHFARNCQSQATVLLLDALRLAQTEDCQRLFLDEGEEMAVLLQTVLPAIRKDFSAMYVRTLLRAFTQPQFEQVERVGRVASPATWSSALGQLIEPLSPQEQRVLRLLVAGYSNPEIAETLVVSVNTVKTQVQSIYRKLNVNSRKEARKAVHNGDSRE
jgi:LuxR family transcriptional regulator, maltose regulon positive regulatory protein